MIRRRVSRQRAAGGGVWSRTRNHGWAAAGIALALGCARLEPSGTEADPPRAAMQQAFGALQSVLPAAFYETGWSDPERQPGIRRSLAALTTAASELERHGSAVGSETFRFLSRSLGDEARSIQREFGRRRYVDASYHTERLAETCIACHVRLPSGGGGEFRGTLLSGIDPNRLSRIARANLQAASRQFEAALDTYEELFGSPRQELTADEFSGAIGDYLITALRARGDARRAERGLEILAQRGDLSAQLEFNLLTWREALRELGPALQEPPSLSRAREILERGRALAEFPLDAADQVHATVASSLVFRWIEQERPEGEALAQALYLLAQTEAFTRRAFERSEIAVYLEQAIRAAPRSDVAALAYARLEAETILSYALAGEDDLAPSELEHLGELRGLMRTESSR